MYKTDTYDETLLNKLEGIKPKKPEVPKEIPSSLRRTHPLHLPNLDETQIVRHFHRLSQMN